MLGEIEKQFGKGAMMRLGRRGRARPECRVVSTGSLGLDIALGTGGLPRGRMVEMYGPESSGKTTLALHVVAEAQRAGGVCAFIDAEHALDVGYARKLGVRTEDLLLSQPDYGEQALEITDMLVQSEAVDVIVVDSVAALVPQAELEGEMGDSHMGLQARLMSQALRKLTGATARGKMLVIFINQLRMKIGVMFGNPETTTGGNALKFYASVRLDMRRIGALKDGEQVVGNRTRVKVVKNKMAAPFREAEFDIGVRPGDLAGGRGDRSGRRGGRAGEERGVDRVRRRAAGQRTRGGPAVPARAPGHAEGDPGEAARARGDRRVAVAAGGRRAVSGCGAGERCREAGSAEGGVVMVIEMLPALITAIRAAAIANDNAPPAPTEAPEPLPGPPLVRALRRRPGTTYASAGNVILPLAFAERMPGWRARAAPRRRA